MADRDPHPTEAVQALVDGRLGRTEREAVARHLEGCAACRAERDVAAGTRRILRTALPAPDLPPGLSTKIGAALDAADRSVERGRWWKWGSLAPVAVALVVLVVFLPGGRDDVSVSEGIVDAVSGDFGALQDGSLSLSLPDADPGALETFFTAHGIDFDTRVFDLGIMGFELAGGRVEPLAGRPSALFAYLGSDGVLMVCRMYLGNLDELPEPSSTLENDGIVFHVYERDGRTLVFWEEGEVVCVLASDAPAQDVIDLSFAKAVKV